jgi:hypothetical protein
MNIILSNCSIARESLQDDTSSSSKTHAFQIKVRGNAFVSMEVRG